MFMIGLYLSLQVFHSSLSSASCSVVVYECREILNSSTCHMMAVNPLLTNTMRGRGFEGVGRQ